MIILISPVVYVVEYFTDFYILLSEFLCNFYHDFIAQDKISPTPQSYFDYSKNIWRI